MSIRLRQTSAGLVAICAARSVPKPDDLYLDDGAHHALTVKFAADFRSMGFVTDTPDPSHPDRAMELAMEAEESNNAGREAWDREYGPPSNEPSVVLPPAVLRCAFEQGALWRAGAIGADLEALREAIRRYPDEAPR